jgi:hypothetical protein
VTDKAPTFGRAFGIDITQAEADFVLPDLAADIPVCIDPFLLYKSRDPFLRDLHGRVLGVFERAFALHAAGDRAGLDRLIDFPEVNAIGFGYTKGRIAGSGLGLQLNTLVADLLRESEAIQERGLRHVEELQLLSVGVGADRVSDITANVLKLPLVEYTQKQAALWGIPLVAGVPLPHVLRHEDMEWRDDYVDLPVNPVSGGPMLLVPRRIVRLLPWINYEDFYTHEAKLFLPPKAKLPRYPGMSAEKRIEVAKAEMVIKVRQDTAVLDRYIAHKERTSALAVPVLHDIDEEVVRATGDDLVGRLDSVPVGAAGAADYQRVVYEVVNFLFAPEITGGEQEVATLYGTERRDILYWNEAETSFWRYVRETYRSALVMFEVKNVAALDLDHVNQTAAYLGARLGMLGFIVTRHPPSESVVRKLYSVYNDTPGDPRKVILVLTDDDLRTMIRGVVAGEPATPHVQRLYRRFRGKIQ